MAKERRVGVHPGKALTEVREKGHARHRIRSKIQEAEAKGMHDVAEEIGEGRTEPAGKIIDKEGVPIWGSLGTVGWDDERGWMPRILPPVFTPHRGLKESRSSNASTVEGKKADCVRCTASALSGGSASPASFTTPLPLVDFGAMAAGGGGQDRGRRKRNGGEQERILEKKRKAGEGFRDWGCAEGKRNSAPAVIPFYGEAAGRVAYLL